MNLTELSAVDIAKGVSEGQFTAEQVAREHLARIEGAEPRLRAFVTLIADEALTSARAVDAKRSRGEKLGALAGVPVALKDNILLKGVETTCSSKILKGYKAAYDATVVERLRAADAVFIGKTNLDEFAMGSSNLTSYHGAVVNPWQRTGSDAKLVPGGSSGGSAAAVAGRIALGATGTDTGGSIRQPAALCGIVGIKPTYGRCSRWGIVAFASSLDQAGPMTRTVRDAAIMLESMCGHDAKDSTSAPMPVPNFEAALTGDIRGLKVGIPKEYRPDGMSDEINAVWDQGIEWLKAAGATPVEISLPHTKYALPTYYIIAPAEASSNLARYDGVRFGLRVPGKTLDELYAKTRAAGFGAEVRRRILIGTYVLSAGYYDAYYDKARRVRTLIARDFENAFKTVDVILTPTAPSPAFAPGEKGDDPVAMYLEDVFTVPTSLAGLPGLSLPAGLNAQGLPLGLQLIGRPFDEATVLRVAEVMEQAADFKALPSGLEG